MQVKYFVPIEDNSCGLLIIYYYLLIWIFADNYEYGQLRTKIIFWSYGEVRTKFSAEIFYFLTFGKEQAKIIE